MSGIVRCCTIAALQQLEPLGGIDDDEVDDQELPFGHGSEIGLFCVSALRRTCRWDF
jgi:hypothetical protein